MNLTWALPIAIVMQTRSAAVSPRPVAWAAQSPRPVLCQGEPALWELSRRAEPLRRCRELARAQALLLGAPEKALARADALLHEAPEFSEARVLHGRASFRVGDSKTALAELSVLLAPDAAAAADPLALLDGGRAALVQNDVASAARFYRTLGSRAALLPERRQQVVAYLEIAATLLAEGGASIDEVLAYLREARRRSAGSGFSGLCAALTALAWVASGREAEGQGALAELGDIDELARLEGRKAVWLPDGMFHALLGLSLENSRPDAAQERYELLSRTALAGTAVGKVAGRPHARPAGGKKRREAK